jgi:hypothetical protein
MLKIGEAKGGPRGEAEVGRKTYNVGADFLAGDLVVDDHGEGGKKGISGKVEI